ncbi:MAG: 3-hydroxyacyl-CoA dehydrogenase NAD-binding domain-containing protein, partial [Candidatus Eremiobacteraeota bacterium]|nr:3-hydroxyacyl-CoA dehydrogenase NAD-binding domain-containing protein [Candidatus Eremiobacteraeota bacterium]
MPLRIAVIGAGQMGAGIAQVAAQSGHSVLLHDRSEELIARGIAGIEKNLARAVEKGRLDNAGREAVLARIARTPALEKLDCDLAIEAATEALDIKLELFRRLDAVTPTNAILASNTSSISITMLGAATKRAERVIGMHFMNPVPVMALVEIIRGIATSQATYDFTE